MKNNNSVCFISCIDDVKEINGADAIEQIIIKGWSCISKKGEYKKGDLVCVATTDAVIPEELSQMMGVANYLRKGTRVRTIKLRGVYSECLIIPFRYISNSNKNEYEEGDDMMEELNIFKFEPPIKSIQLASGKKIRYQNNPNFHVYYKFPNIKNVPNIFNETDIVQMSRKIHGTNARYGIVRKNKLSLFDKIKKFFGISRKWIDFEFVVGSHNVEKGSDSQGFYDTNVWFEIAKKYNIENKLWDYVKSFDPEDIGSGITIYGEIYGPGIQKNYDYNLKELELVCFDVSENSKYLDTSSARIMIESILELPHVNILYEGPYNIDMQNKFTNDYILNTKIPHEGIVVKHVSGERNKIAKIINPEYLIYAEKKDVGDSH